MLPTAALSAKEAARTHAARSDGLGCCHEAAPKLLTFHDSTPTRRGHCIFMQGSRIAHAVTPVLHAREPRLTLVNSYQSLNPFSSDRTVFATFNGQDSNAKYGLAAATRTVAGLSVISVLHLSLRLTSVGSRPCRVGDRVRAARSVARARPARPPHERRGALQGRRRRHPAAA